jgi:hypothetical protein
VNVLFEDQYESTACHRVRGLANSVGKIWAPQWLMELAMTKLKREL